MCRNLNAFLRQAPYSYTKIIVMRFTVILVVGLMSLSSCLVSKKKFDAERALSDKYAAQLKDCNGQLQSTQDSLNSFKNANGDLQTKLDKLNTDIESLDRQYKKAKSDYIAEQAQCEALRSRIEDLGKTSSSEREKLSLALAEKEKALAEREKRINDLESLIAKKDEAVASLKKKISDALTGFNSSELTVTQKDGKVYVSLSDKLLFKSGSFSVDEKGKQAIVKVSEVLNKQTEIGIVIEGHTDNKHYINPKGEIKNNWDLSVMRATSVTEIMINEGAVDAKRITAAGHGEFFPVESNETAEGRSKNRRIEIVLSPDLKEIFQILDNTVQE